MDRIPSFEEISFEFLDLCADRYPTADKVLAIAKRLGMETLEGKIILVNQLRDAVRKVSLSKIYTSVEHRNDVFKAIIEASENLEDQLEEQLDREEQES